LLQVYAAQSLASLAIEMPEKEKAQAIHRAALHSPAYTLPENLLQLLLAVSDGRGDDAAAMAIKISGLKEDFSENTFRQRVSGLVRCKILQA
jgi:hypothetical protein